MGTLSRTPGGKRIQTVLRATAHKLLAGLISFILDVDVRWTSLPPILQPHILSSAPTPSPIPFSLELMKEVLVRSEQAATGGLLQPQDLYSY